MQHLQWCHIEIICEEACWESHSWNSIQISMFIATVKTIIHKNRHSYRSVREGRPLNAPASIQVNRVLSRALLRELYTLNTSAISRHVKFNDAFNIKKRNLCTWWISILCTKEINDNITTWIASYGLQPKKRRKTRKNVLLQDADQRAPQITGTSLNISTVAIDTVQLHESREICEITRAYIRERVGFQIPILCVSERHSVHKARQRESSLMWKPNPIINYPVNLGATHLRCHLDDLLYRWSLVDYP